tara:strand:- start:88 stop:384 length:297 start_codon:yes stop_codon:yes gene_type:complete
MEVTTISTTERFIITTTLLSNNQHLLKNRHQHLGRIPHQHPGVVQGLPEGQEAAAPLEVHEVVAEAAVEAAEARLEVLQEAETAKAAVDADVDTYRVN